MYLLQSGLELMCISHTLHLLNFSWQAGQVYGVLGGAETAAKFSVVGRGSGTGTRGTDRATASSGGATAALATTFDELGAGVSTQPNRSASLLSSASTADSREVTMYGGISVGMVLTYLDSRTITLRTQTDRRILIEEATMQK